MPQFHENVWLTRDTLMSVHVCAPPDVEGAIIALTRNNGGNSTLNVWMTKEEAIKFADSLPNLQAFIHGAFGLMDGYADEFEKRRREAEGLGFTDPD